MVLDGVATRCRVIFQTQAALAAKRTCSRNVSSQSLDSGRLQVQQAELKQLKQKPAVAQLGFGKTFTDHMMTVEWSQDQGWGQPSIRPVENFSMHPGAKVLHYAQELFEGMKAYRGVDDKIRLFRPMHNMARMNLTAARACLPQFDGEELLECIRRLCQIDQDWVPHDTSASLYIRPTMIGVEPTLGVAPSNQATLFVLLSPVGPYFSTGLKPVNLLCDPRYVRAWPGGSGYTKMGSNYAPTLWTQKVAEQHGCHQCLWLFGDEHDITEVGAMNLFVVLRRGDGLHELVTPPLTTGTILPGVTRRSIIELTQSWPGLVVSERRITMQEVMSALSSGDLVEMFGSGTAAVVSPVGGLHYEGRMNAVPTPADGLAVKILAAMTDIYYGKVKHPWAIDIEEWDIDKSQVLMDYAQPEQAEVQG